jgi:hypothetical protein
MSDAKDPSSLALTPFREITNLINFGPFLDSRGIWHKNLCGELMHPHFLLKLSLNGIEPEAQ